MDGFSMTCPHCDQFVAMEEERYFNHLEQYDNRVLCFHCLTFFDPVRAIEEYAARIEAEASRGESDQVEGFVED